MPTASVKIESNGVADPSDALQKLQTVLQERVTKLEKRKYKMERDPSHPKGTFYKNLSFDQITYKKLTTEQMNHLRNMDVAYSNIEASKELTDIVKTHIADFRAQVKKKEKKASQDKARDNFERVKEVVSVQVALKLLADKPEAFAGEVANFPTVPVEFLERLQKVHSNITPSCPTDSTKTIKELVAPVAEHIHLLLDGRKKFVTKATSYRDVKDLVMGSLIDKCFYIEPPMPAPEVEEEEPQEHEQVEKEQIETQDESPEASPSVSEDVPNEEETTVDITPEPEVMVDFDASADNVSVPSEAAISHPTYTHPAALYEASALVDAPPPPGLPHPHCVEVSVPQEITPEVVIDTIEINKPHNVSISELITRGTFDFLQDSVIDGAPSEVYRDPAVVSIGSIPTHPNSHINYNNTSSTSPPLNNMTQSYPAPHDQYYNTPPPPPAATQAPLAAAPPNVDNTPNPPPPIPMPISLDLPNPNNWKEVPATTDSWCEDGPDEHSSHHHNGGSSSGVPVKSAEGGVPIKSSRTPVNKSSTGVFGQSVSPPVMDTFIKEKRDKEMNWAESDSMQWNEDAPSGQYTGKENKGAMESWAEEPRRGGAPHDGERKSHYYRGNNRMRRDEDDECGEEHDGGNKMWGNDNNSYDDRSRGGMFRRGGRGGRMNGGGGYRGRGSYGGGYQNGRGGYSSYRGNRGMNGGNGPMRGGGLRGGGMSNGGNRGSNGGGMNRGGSGAGNPSNYRGSRNNYNNQQQRSYYHQQHVPQI